MNSMYREMVQDSQKPSAPTTIGTMATGENNLRDWADESEIHHHIHSPQGNGNQVGVDAAYLHTYLLRAAHTHGWLFKKAFWQQGLMLDVWLDVYTCPTNECSMVHVRVHPLQTWPAEIVVAGPGCCRTFVQKGHGRW